MTKLFLLFHGRFPSEKAAALFAAKSAEAFGKAGLNVTLLVPRRLGNVKEDPFVFYSLERNFKITYIPTIDLFGFRYCNVVAFWMSFFVFSLFSFFYVKRLSTKEDIIYSNETLPLFFASYIRPKCFYEMHDFPESKKALFRWFLERMSFILVHNSWKLNEIKKIFPSIPENRLLLEPNAVDIKVFDTGISIEDARRQLSLPLDKKIIVYTGHLYDWKGVHVLARAAQLLPGQFLVIFIGGTESDIKAFKEKYDGVQTISIVGFKHHKEIPLWQKAADILVLPNSAKENISIYYTSPMKLYEYMASRKPIIASDIPSIREIVDEQSVVLVIPDNPEVLARVIENTVRSTQSTLVQNAYIKVLEHTWDKRAERILRFMNI